MSNNSSKSSSLKKVVFVGGLVCLTKLLGILKQTVVAYAFGTSADTDVFFAADGFISTFIQILSAAIVPALVTEYIFVRNNYQDGEERSKRLVRQCFSFFFIASLAIALLSIALSPFISKLIGFSFSDSNHKRLAYFLIGLSPTIVLAAINSVAQGYLNANNKYTPGKLLGTFYAVFIIASILVFKQFIGIESLLIGFISGYAIHTVFILLFLRKKIPLKGGNFLKNNDFRRLIVSFLPILLSVSIVDIGQLIDKVVSSSLAEGSVTILNYSQVVSSDLVNSIVISVVGMVLLTTFSNKYSNKNNICEIKSEFTRTATYLSAIILLIVVLYI